MHFAFLCDATTHLCDRYAEACTSHCGLGKVQCYNSLPLWCKNIFLGHPCKFSKPRLILCTHTYALPILSLPGQEDLRKLVKIMLRNGHRLLIKAGRAGRQGYVYWDIYVTLLCLGMYRNLLKCPGSLQPFYLHDYPSISLQSMMTQGAWDPSIEMAHNTLVKSTFCGTLLCLGEFLFGLGLQRRRSLWIAEAQVFEENLGGILVKTLFCFTGNSLIREYSFSMRTMTICGLKSRTVVGVSPQLTENGA